jgi:acyl-coenzyme A thioesterase PaaI-like protein
LTSELAGRAVPTTTAAARAGELGAEPPGVDSPGGVDGGSPMGTARVTIDGQPFPIRPHHCFACGALNVEGVGLALHVEGDGCWTELELPDRFEGWQGIAHGGIVCTILDEVMAWSLVARDSWGLTARMTVDFKRPVPIGTPIRAEGQLVRIRRRLMETTARLVDGTTGELLATAEAIYVAAPPDRKAELKRRYGFLPEPDDAPPGPDV